MLRRQSRLACQQNEPLVPRRNGLRENQRDHILLHRASRFAGVNRAERSVPFGDAVSSEIMALHAS